MNIVGVNSYKDTFLLDFCNNISKVLESWLLLIHRDRLARNGLISDFDHNYSGNI